MKNHLIESVLKSVVVVELVFISLGIFLVILENLKQEELIHKINNLLLK